MNTTQSPLEASFILSDYYVACALSALIAVIAILIAIVILVLVRRSKPRLHTVRHLLMCNTCVASILYCVIQTMNYVFLIFLRWDTSDASCRLRGYLAYLTICAFIYSFFIQAISRLFISIYSASHKWLTTFNAHYILIFLQWLTVVLLPLPALVTTDIRYRPTSMCFVPIRYFIHVVYTYVAYYIFPAFSICAIYVFIYRRLRSATRRAETRIRSTNSDKRDLEVLRNILIFLSIYLLGGVPSILFILTTNKIIYLLSIVTITFAVAVEKVFTILLDRDMRQVVFSIVRPGTRVIPFESSMTGVRGLEAPYTVQQMR
jgi:hypothetical protein